MDTTTIIDFLTTAGTALLIGSPVVYLLERTHRRASIDAGGRLGGLGTEPGPDERRVRDELRARSFEEHPARDTTTAPVPRLRGRRHSWVSAPR